MNSYGAHSSAGSGFRLRLSFGETRRSLGEGVSRTGETHMYRFLATLAALVLAAATAFAQSAAKPAAAKPVATQPLVEFEMMTWPEVKQALESGKSTALVYTGGTEQRGPQ